METNHGIGGRTAVRAGLALLVAALLGAWLTVAGVVGAGAATDEEAGAAYADRGPYDVATEEIEVQRAGSDETFGARLFVPLPPKGDRAADDERSAVYAFGHGFLSPVEPYEGTLDHLASWGIAVVAPRSEGGPLPSHERFAGDLLAALDAVALMASADDWPGLPVDATARAVGGHSMGGGAAVLAAAMDPSVRTAATLAAADTRPSAIEAAAAVDVPLLLIAASEDRITPVHRHQRPMFEAAGGLAQLRVIEGGGHCGFLDQAGVIDLVCGRPSLDAETQRDVARAALAAWIRAEAMDDAAAATAAWEPDPGGATSVEVRGSGS